MTEDPVRLLSQEGDALTTSLLKAARDGDRDAARSHKAVVLGVAGGAAAASGAALAAARLAPKGFFAMVGGKWILSAIVALGGLGLGAALLWPRDAHQAPPDLPAGPAHVAAPAVPQETSPPHAEPAAPAQDPASALQDPAPNDPASAPNDPASNAPGNPARADAPASNPPARSGIASPSRDARAAVSASPSAAPSSSGSPGLAEEVAALRAAHDALGAGQPQRCLDAVNAYFAAFPSGRLSAEARYLRAEALFAAGRRDEAAALARTILAGNPRSTYAARLRAIAGDPAP